jgi:hypothetical protein
MRGCDHSRFTAIVLHVSPRYKSKSLPPLFISCHSVTPKTKAVSFDELPLHLTRSKGLMLLVDANLIVL